MRSIVYEGNNYEEIDYEVQKMLKMANIFTFQFYIKDRLWVSSKAIMEKFHIEKFYHVTNLDKLPTIFYAADLPKIRRLYAEIMLGKSAVYNEVRSYDGESYYKITLIPSKYDEDGKLMMVSVVLEDFDDRIKQMSLMQMLSDEYYSVFLADFVEDRVITYRMKDTFEARYGTEMGKMPSYQKIMEAYIKKDVMKEDQKEMLRKTSKENLEKEFQKCNTFYFDYRIMRDGRPEYIKFKAVKMNAGDNLTKMIIGFADAGSERVERWGKLSFYDPVTKGNNYTYFAEKLSNERRDGYVVSLDIKDFKMVNNVCGIERGDLVLQEVSRLLDGVINDQGFFGHVNSDHYALFLPYEKEEDVEIILNRITGGFVELVKNCLIPKISPYFGASRWKYGERIQLIFGQANTAKHRIKKNSNTNYGFYHEEDTKAAIEVKRMEDSFEDAIAKEQFEIWYQPKYSPIEKELTGAEALIRWRMPDGELVPPAKFIPVFEMNGMIRELDRFVFKKVCKQQRKWIEEIGATVPVSVNLSRASLFYENIVEEYVEIAKEIGVLPQLVPIEITESAAIENQEIQSLSMKFSGAGFPLHIDDFGTGYSSLSTLNMMRLDTLKLDKSLIDYIGEFGGDRLIKHTVALAKDMGIHVTAEGVENNEQVQFLKEVDCDNIQGYIYSRPIPTEFFTEKLKNEKMSEKYLFRKGQLYTYPMLVDIMRRVCSDAASEGIEGHAAIQINIYGEGEGAFYIEFNNGKVHVEPYEYYDRDVLLSMDAQTLIQILKRVLSLEQAYQEGRVSYTGDWGAALLVEQVVKRV